MKQVSIEIVSALAFLSILVGAGYLLGATVYLMTMRPLCQLAGC